MHHKAQTHSHKEIFMKRFWTLGAAILILISLLAGCRSAGEINGDQSNADSNQVEHMDGNHDAQIPDQAGTENTSREQAVWSIEGSTLKISGAGPLISTPWKNKGENTLDRIRELQIGDGVTQLPYLAFAQYPELRKVTIGAGLTTIEPDAFLGCEKLAEVSIGEGVSEIEGSAFERCGLTQVVIPDSVSVIRGSAFANCAELTEITIPASVTEIGQGAFEGCKNLTIHAPGGSYAETYAKEQKIPFRKIG